MGFVQGNVLGRIEPVLSRTLQGFPNSMDTFPLPKENLKSNRTKAEKIAHLHDLPSMTSKF